MRSHFMLMAVLATCWATVSRAETSAVTWEWYNAGETYMRYKPQTADNMRIAFKYYLMAAEHGNLTAAYKVGEAYETGHGVAGDPVQALTWYRKSADAGDKYAEVKVGYFYQKGLGIPADPVEAVRWFRLAAKQDNIWAYHMLAFMLADGQGLPQDKALAISYFEKSLPITHDPWAKWKLAHLVGPTDPQRGLALLQEAARAGNTQAMQELAQDPATGRPAPKPTALVSDASARPSVGKGAVP